MAAAAVLLMNSVIKVATKQMHVNTTRGLEPHIPKMLSANSLAMPVFSMAAPKQMEPAKIIRIFQSIDLRACSTEQQRVSSMAPAAKKHD